MRKEIASGDRFNRLVAMEPTDDFDAARGRYWTFRCDCGAITRTTDIVVRTGRTRSCGCLMREKAAARATKHGGCGTREHRIWKAMLTRCYNPKATGYYLYGKKGVRVCDQWRTSFPAFLADMGPAPTDKHTIDRIDSEGDYEPANCRWADRVTQGRNTNRNRFLTHDGATRTVAEWAEITGIPSSAIRYRIDAARWTVAEALTIPSGGGRVNRD